MRKMQSIKPTRLLFAGIWAVAFVWGATAAFERLTLGDQLTNLTSYVPWGLWVAGYIYFIGLSAGAFLLSSLAYGLGVKRLEPVGKFALFTAIVTLFMALLGIWFDIGHPFRALEIFSRPQFNSMMAWMVWLYAAYFILLLTELGFAFRVDYPNWAGSGSVKRLLSRVLLLGQGAQQPATLKRDRQVLKTLAVIGIPLAVAFHGGVGALFATVAAQEVWHSSLFPILFLVGALFSGGALLTSLVSFFWRSKDAQWHDIVVYLGRVTLALALVYGLLEWSEYSIPLWYGVGDVRDIQALSAILFGQYWYVFWVFQIALGLAVPILLLLLFSRRPLAIGVAGAVVSFTFIGVRLNFVVPAFVAPQLQGLSAAYLDPRLVFEYLPSLFEWQLVFFVVTLGLGLLYVGNRLLPLAGAVASDTKGMEGDSPA